MIDIIACVAVPVSRGTLSPAPGRKPARPTARRTLHLAGPSDDDSGRPDMKGQATGRGSGRDSCGRGLRGRKAGGGVGAAASWAAMLNVRGQVCAEHLWGLSRGGSQYQPEADALPPAEQRMSIRAGRKPGRRF